MTLQEIIDSAQDVLNRDDCTDDQMAVYVGHALRRIQRECRLPIMEREAQFTTVAAGNAVSFPSDLLQVIDVYITDGNTTNPRALRKASSYRKLLEEDWSNIPRAYARYRNGLKVAGTIKSGSVITLHYYGEFSTIASRASSNEATAAIPDLIIYGSLAFAADTYSHPAAMAWEARYQALREATKQLAQDLDIEGGPQTVEPLYEDPSL